MGATVRDAPNAWAAAERAAPSVSVVIPTYGHRDFVLATLASVWAQTFQDFEVIVVNDGSPDDTGALLAPLAASGRIRYVEQSNQGQAAARNRGIAQARGAFIALLDDDDLWPPGKLAWQVEALHEHPDVAVVYGRLETIDDQGEPVPLPYAPGSRVRWPRRGPSGDVYRNFVMQNWIVSPGQCLVRRSALLARPTAAFDPDIWGCDDWDLWLRLAESWKFLFVDVVALRYRLHAQNASRDVSRMQHNFTVLYKKHIRRNHGNPDRIRSLVDAYLAYRVDWKLQQARREVKQATQKVDQLQREVDQLQRELVAVQGSAFWKLRTRWFQLKRLVAGARDVV